MYKMSVSVDETNCNGIKSESEDICQTLTNTMIEKCYFIWKFQAYKSHDNDHQWAGLVLAWLP